MKINWVQLMIISEEVVTSSPRKKKTDLQQVGPESELHIEEDKEAETSLGKERSVRTCSETNLHRIEKIKVAFLDHHPLGKEIAFHRRCR